MQVELYYHKEFRLRSAGLSSGPKRTEGTGIDPKGTEFAGNPRNSEGICTLVHAYWAEAKEATHSPRLSTNQRALACRYQVTSKQ